MAHTTRDAEPYGLDPATGRATPERAVVSADLPVQKRVVVPDLADARGRGSSRRFSSRNLLEFAVALHLRTVGLPAASIAAILYTLRAFEKRVASEIPGFEIVEALRAPNGIDVRAIVRDGNRLDILLRQPGQGAQLFGGAQLSGAKSTAGLRSASRVRPVFKAIVQPDSGGFEGPEGSRYVRLDINIAQIARDLKLEE